MKNVNDVAKRTLDKIAKAEEKLNALNAKRDELTSDYQKKYDAISETIKEQEKELAALRAKEKSEKLDAVAKMLGKSGLNVDDLLNAVANGDLYGIQEAIENGGKATPAEPAVSEDAVDETSDETSADTAEDEQSDSDSAYTENTDAVQEDTAQETGESYNDNSSNNYGW